MNIEDGLPCGCGLKHLIGIEYPWTHPEYYDGVSEWKCRSCNRRWGKWSGRELKEGEVEKRYGEEKNERQ